MKMKISKKSALDLKFYDCVKIRLKTKRLELCMENCFFFYNFESNIEQFLISCRVCIEPITQAGGRFARFLQDAILQNLQRLCRLLQNSKLYIDLKICILNKSNQHFENLDKNFKEEFKLFYYEERIFQKLNA
ncbi:hypothetical protein BpHYR1_032979 [Brachionus plicatilis]|uniref:Uncharacterized protein n=1 Tax=Brachionus plicatilis TaxID=10195 RepID=A0A3M7REV4_BRAPC|nr:hypothetical protein BpHYR1_032979 [Brachionus plicatilis]